MQLVEDHWEHLTVKTCSLTFNPCVSVRSPGPCVLSHCSAITSFPMASLATIPPVEDPDLLHLIPSQFKDLER